MLARFFVLVFIYFFFSFLFELDLIAIEITRHCFPIRDMKLRTCLSRARRRVDTAG